MLMNFNGHNYFKGFCYKYYNLYLLLIIIVGHSGSEMRLPFCVIDIWTINIHFVVLFWWACLCF